MTTLYYLQKGSFAHFVSLTNRSSGYYLQPANDSIFVFRSEYDLDEYQIVFIMVDKKTGTIFDILLCENDIDEKYSDYYKYGPNYYIFSTPIYKYLFAENSESTVFDHHIHEN